MENTWKIRENSGGVNQFYRCLHSRRLTPRWSQTAMFFCMKTLSGSFV